MAKSSSFSIIKKLSFVAFVGMFISACANTMEGVGKDLQTMGTSMGGGKSSNTNQSQTQGKDVVVTPVK